jgi:hypothetical protein
VLFSFDFVWNNPKGGSDQRVNLAVRVPTHRRHTGQKKKTKSAMARYNKVGTSSPTGNVSLALFFQRWLGSDLVVVANNSTLADLMVWISLVLLPVFSAK